MKADDPSVEDSGKRTEPLDLLATHLITQRPGAEVLTIIPQNVVPALTKPRSRTLHHVATIEASSVSTQADGMAMRKVFERNLLHRPAPQSACEAGVVNDLPAAHVDAVVAVKRASCN